MVAAQVCPVKLEVHWIVGALFNLVSKASPAKAMTSSSWENAQCKSSLKSCQVDSNKGCYLQSSSLTLIFFSMEPQEKTADIFILVFVYLCLFLY